MSINLGEIKEGASQKIRQFGQILSNVGKSLKRLLGGRWGLILTNVATIVGTIIAAAQVQFFEQIPEVKVEICANKRSEKAWKDLIIYRDTVIFIRFLFTENCLIEENSTSLFVKSVKIKEDALFTTFQFDQGTRSSNLTANENLNPYQIKIANDIGYSPPQIANDSASISFAKPYLVKMDYNPTAAEITLIPVPRTEKLSKQIACLKKRWPGWMKSFLCPFIPAPPE